MHNPSLERKVTGVSEKLFVVAEKKNKNSWSKKDGVAPNALSAAGSMWNRTAWEGWESKASKQKPMCVVFLVLSSSPSLLAVFYTRCVAVSDKMPLAGFIHSCRSHNISSIPTPHHPCKNETSRF